MTAAEQKVQHIELRDVSMIFGAGERPIARWLARLVKPRTVVAALQHVNIAIARGEAVGLVGESGSGKSTSGRLMMGMLKPTSGTVYFGGADVAGMDRKQLKALRSRLQMVYQNALGSLDSRMRIGASIAEPLRIHRRGAHRAQLRERAIEVLEMVGLRPGEVYLDRFPSELSGGQQQRVVIARALVTEPEALILDESLASADVSIRVTLLDLLMELRQRLSLSYVFITHELALARYLCDRLVIMYRGEVVEVGPTEVVFTDPQHPYTRALIDAVPAHGKSRFEDSPVQLKTDTLLVRGTVGCPLYGRCPIGVAGVCDVTAPKLVPVGDAGREAACHFAGTAAKPHAADEVEA